MQTTSDSPKASAPQTWKLGLIVDKAFVPALEEALMEWEGADSCESPPTVSSFEVDEDGEEWIVEAFFKARPDLGDLTGLIENLAVTFGQPQPKIDLAPVEDKDWVRESQKLLQPITAGRFYVYGSHDADTLPKDKIGLLVDAGQAFGSGSHETTRGCLLLIDELADQLQPASVLDLGCGSGILGIAAAKVWASNHNCLVVGSDIDPIATATALENAVINGVEVVGGNKGERGFYGLTCPGFDAPELSRLAPFDLIIANILMEPLLNLAGDVARNVKPGGLVILSGLLDSQKERILAAYAVHGLKLKKCVPLKQWHTLLLSE
jgi:ribosomal protein L11 methyltransferase